MTAARGQVHEELAFCGDRVRPSDTYRRVIVSEVLGLAWSDVDLNGAVATVSRASVDADGTGMMLGPPKTEGAKGRHHLSPVVVRAAARLCRA